MINKLIVILCASFLTFGCSQAEENKTNDEKTSEQTANTGQDVEYSSLEDLAQNDTKEVKETKDEEELSPKEKMIKSMLDNPHEPPFLFKDGEKWDADKATIDRIKNIHEMYKSFIANKRTDYKNFGKDVNQASIAVLDECKMTEPDLGALYAWMAPIVAFSGMLQEVSSDELNARIIKKADEKLSEFDKFFE